MLFTELGLIPPIAAAVAAVEAPKMEAPSQAKVAATVAKDVMQDMVPANRRPLIYTIIAIVAVLILMLLFRSCGW